MSNMAIVPTNNGSIDAFAAALTQLLMDISAYFAPSRVIAPATVRRCCVPDSQMETPTASSDWYLRYSSST